MSVDYFPNHGGCWSLSIDEAWWWYSWSVYPVSDRCIMYGPGRINCLKTVPLGPEYFLIAKWWVPLDLNISVSSSVMIILMIRRSEWVRPRLLSDQGDKMGDSNTWRHPDLRPSPAWDRRDTAWALHRACLTTRGNSREDQVNLFNLWRYSEYQSKVIFIQN